MIPPVVQLVGKDFLLRIASASWSIKSGNGHVGVLAITGEEVVARDGAVIAFAMNNNYIVLDINTRTTHHSRLAPSSQSPCLAGAVQ